VISEEVYGCLVLFYSAPRRFSEEEISLAVVFADQVALAIENDRLKQRARQAAILEERGRLAREMHDSVTQSLYSLTLLAEGWQRMARSGKVKNLTEPLSELGEIAQQALKEMRLLVYELRPPMLEQVGLLGALNQRLAIVEKRAGVEARLLADEIDALPVSLEEELYRIAQEALNNSLKHAGATGVTVYLRKESEWLILEISDNGKGFDIHQEDGQGGLGLASMQERAERLGGSLEITCAPGQGTSVRVRVLYPEVKYE
jgi:signal transduction histidine kinase